MGLAWAAHGSALVLLWFAPPMGQDPTPVILVADDDPVMVRLLEINFRLEGLSIRSAARGDEALALAREIKPAVVILDLTIPGMDGWQVRERLRDDPETADIPVIVISARTQDEALEQGYALGVEEEDYIMKPFDPQVLVERVHRLLRRSQ
jgi:DNA-binding response OmpR family regulator